MKNNLILIIYSVLLISCGHNEGSLFKNPTPEETNILFTNTLTETDDVNILDYLYFYNGGGVAIGDINNDGLPDIYLSGNQVKNKLYLNKGKLVFEDITQTAGVAGNSSWNTGTIMGDVNGDGLLDIYVCAVVGINGFSGHNELFLNNGNNTFTESAAEYGLDYDSYSSSAAFIDYDADGDLDIYLLNHAVHTQESFGKANLRLKRDFQSGDKLLRNDNGKFIDVSKSAGIYGGVNGYGLGISIADFNQDGYPDIYIGNDFHEDDYYYLNNGNGTFTESLRDNFGHTSRFTMGMDAADINHDGWSDLLTLDMLAEDEKVLKSSEGDDDIQIQKLRTGLYGYHYQFTRNMLQVNQKDAPYSETALLSGISATDWSWSALFGDYDQDGEQDVFISNGIPKRPNDLDFINFASNEQIVQKLNNTKLVDKQALNMMPSGAAQNYIFKGLGDLKFKDESKTWIANDSLISGASAFADLDNDGDLDIVVNNINTPAQVYVNQTNSKARYLKLKFEYSKKNNDGIGTKVFTYTNNILQYKELYTARGFQSSSEPIVHFGFNQTEKIDSIKIIWPNNTYQVLKNVKTNQTLTLKPENTKTFDYNELKTSSKKLFNKAEGNLGINFTHKEDNYIDFNRQKLMPYQISDNGPALAIGDINNDGKEDIFFGGSKLIPSQIYIQNDRGFVRTKYPSIFNDSIKEDIATVIADFNGDKKNDLFIATGGGDFYNKMAPLNDSYYVAKDSVFELKNIVEDFENASIVKPFDYDNDGDLDLFIGNYATSNDFGKIPSSYLLNNNKGNFIKVKNKALEQTGMITDAIWDDFDNDGIKDLIIVGEWMSPLFFKNDKGNLIKTDVNLRNSNGLWQTIIPFDIDNDGDKDYLIGNWGTNTKFIASEKYPLKMYYSDFDKNGSTETIVAIEKNNAYYPLENAVELTSQLVSLKKKFPTYKSLAGKTVDQIFGTDIIKKATLFSVQELRSGYLKNDNNKFTFVAFENKMQTAPITAFVNFDFDKDGRDEILAGGNYFGVKPFQGRFDSFSGALIKNINNIKLGNEIGLDFSLKSVRHLNIIYINKKPFLLATINNDKIQVYNLLD
ncbi:FG-GAP repeat protein [Cellulophaga algicola DSM 14237]|uniref:FG-GAP repeat protein n=1 Tax=Cellulophaga algicola (strain DSM 14237 / IC166 / ACAM 630) TaxID=688270 RepID=E6X4Z8_CELAD|nr:VCBS repeat-containing protein [Cellulophaga algicola]ADV48309.1 FG-GAP repeat protein [Cellulophaga algicola DSM 14237]